MRNKSLLILLLILLLPWKSISQVNLTSKDSNASKLSLYLRNHVREVAYLQFDKPYYAAGDSIYFKAYVTAGEQHKLSGISGVLHVDLINTNNKIDQSITLQLDSGLAWGDFVLPDSLPPGNYWIRAYTQWMRNEGEGGFFEKIIPIGSAKAGKVPENMTENAFSNPKPDIQFLPEGGDLIAGIKSKIAFKAVDRNGLGVDASGVIVDNDDKVVASFASAHLGMGYFYLTPMEGKTYSAKISYSGSLRDVMPLPMPGIEGITLSVNNEALPEASISIIANNAYFKDHKGNHYTLLIYSGSLVTTVDCKLDSPVTKLDILKRKLPTGVATVTLFGSADEALCERLFFVQNYDQLSLDVRSAKDSYSKREKVYINLSVLNRKSEAAKGHFSVSVVNENLLPEKHGNGDNILSNLLLTSALKGHIEQPGYYFADTAAVVRDNLDVLMLTQGYRRFEWKQIVDSSAIQASYKAEAGLPIDGQVTSLTGKPIANGTVNLISTNGGLLLSTSTDNNGFFHFAELLFTDTAHFVLSAVNGKGKNSTKISYFNDKKNFPTVLVHNTVQNNLTYDGALKTYAENAKRQHEEILNYDPGKATMLKQVNIKSRKPADQYYTQSLAGAGNADQVIHSKDVLYGGPLSVRLSGMIHGAHFINGRGPNMIAINNITRVPLYVIVDGSPGNLDDVSTDGFSTIEILMPPTSYIYGSEGGSGVIIITTKPRGSEAEDIPSIGVLPITVMGFYKARQFYSPKYDTPAALNSKQRDLRSTIYWNPEIKTDKDGNASFEFYNADGTGTYKITIEGIDKDGNIGRQVYRYEVK